MVLESVKMYRGKCQQFIDFFNLFFKVLRFTNIIKDTLKAYFW